MASRRRSWMASTFLYTLICILFQQVAIAAADDDASVLLTELGRASNQSLLWGPYRPNVYFGTKPRIPKSLYTGLMWSKLQDYETPQHTFRHTCEQSDNMAGYGWEEYDVRSGGRQVIYDPGNGIDITTEFVKIPGGNHGGSWGVRVKGTPRPDAPADLHTTAVFYVALEGLGAVEVIGEKEPLGFEENVILEGETPELGSFTLEVTKGPEGNTYPDPTHPSFEEKPLDRTYVSSVQVPEEVLWQTKQLLFRIMQPVIQQYVEKYGSQSPPPPWQTFTIPNDPGQGNLHVIQKVFTGAFEFDVLFKSGSSTENLNSASLTDQIESATESVTSRFSSIFKPKAPFTKPDYVKFSRSLFSNLIGGIGYFYGNAIIDRSYAPEYDEENEGFWEEAAEARSRGAQALEGPYELYTSIPSRPFFPRGFLWDEGFHLLPVVDWDADLSLEIVRSWFNLMDEDGWIAREQILGLEARSKVPPEFQVQYPHYANPPTLFMVLDAFLDRFSLNGTSSVEDPTDLHSLHLANPEVAVQYFKTLYPLLRRHYFWFRKTQQGDLKSYDREAYSSREAYRWRGRTQRHILTSGIDDYPRAQPPHPGELHTDLISWMGMMSRSLKRIASFLGEEEDAVEFAGYENAIVRNIDDLHWDDKEKTYCDATIDDYEESVHVCHKGYVSIFPFMLGLLPPDSLRLGAILDLISDPEELWSPYGLRSLSKKDEYYGTDENYWRSPVWMNMNYLALSQLLELAKVPGPNQDRAKTIYTDLRRNIVENVYDQWKKTGFAWEQYNPDTGAGQRTAHFTGWTSLVVKMMTMPDLSGSSKGHDEL